MKRLGVALATTLMLVSAGAATAACKLGRIVEFPVTMHGLAPWTTVKINGQDASFILDSGAFYSTMSPAKAAELHLPLESAPFGFEVIGVGGAAPHVNIATVDTLTIAGVTVPRVQFLVAAMGGGGSAGLLGENILHIADVEYDLAHGSVWLMRPEGCGRAVLAYWAKGIPYNVIDQEIDNERDHHIYGDVIVNGVRLKAMFDTGFNSSTITSRAAARAGLRPEMEGAKPVGVIIGIGSKVNKSWSVPVASFKIGDEEIKNTRIQIGGVELDNTDMTLGADFFLAHHVYVANSQRKIYFTYNGGSVFNLTTPPHKLEGGDAAANSPPPVVPGAPSATSPQAPAAPSNSDAPKDAEGYSRRGSALAAQKDYEAAIAEYTKAIQMKPDEGRYYFQRAQAHMGLRQAFLAMADLDETLKHQPDNVDALITRAELRTGGQDQAGAAHDLDSASAAAAVQADIRLRMALDDERLERFDQAIAELDRWLPAHLDEVQAPQAYNTRCWARANLGRDLDKALDDCNRSIRGGRNGANLDSRGLVHLRRGEYDQAIADYNAALAIRANLAWSLFGRGVAQIYKGERAAGDLDIAAAKAIAPKIVETARSRGITVPASPPPSK